MEKLKMLANFSYFRISGMLILLLLLIPEISVFPAAQSVANIRLKFYTSTKNNDYPLPNEPITLRVDTQNFDASTNATGSLVFRQIPCNKEVTLYFRGTPQAVFKRYIKCGYRISWVYFFNSFEGEQGRIEQQK